MSSALAGRFFITEPPGKPVSLFKCWLTVAYMSQRVEWGVHVSYGELHPLSAGKGSSSVAFLESHAWSSQAGSPHPRYSHPWWPVWRKMSRPGCACLHSQMAVFASPGGGEVAEAAYQRLEPKREGSGWIGGCCSLDCQPLPPAVTCRGCGQGCKSCSGDREAFVTIQTLCMRLLTTPHFTTEEIGSEGLEGSVGLAAVHSELQRASIFVNTGSPVSEDAEMHFRCGSILIGCWPAG